MHLAFTAQSREVVNEFYRAALLSGGESNGEPGIREQLGPNYYAAYVLDLDGNNIEAVCHKPS
jgi:predicted lactoylglutathione lyase